MNKYLSFRPSKVLIAVLFLLPPLLKSFLVVDQIVIPKYWPHDDLLYLNWAKNIIDGNWLGPFSNLSYSKLPGYSIWIAFTYKISIPLLTAQHIVQLLSATIIALIFRKAGVNLIVIYCAYSAIVLAPHGMSHYQTRLFRDYFYGELTLLYISLLSGILLTWKWKPFLLFSVVSSLLLGFYSIVREEIIWIFPTIAVTCFLYWLKKRNQGNLNRRIFNRALLLIFLTLSLVALTRQTLAYKNFQSYGDWDSWHWDPFSGKGSEMLSSLARIDDGKPREKHVSITRKKLQLAFSESPNMKSIQEPIERMYKTRFTREGAFLIGKNEQINEGSMYWLLTSAAAEKGYYKSASTALSFYNSVINEIDLACESGRLKCAEKHSIFEKLLEQEIRRSYLENLVKVFYEIWRPRFINDREELHSGDLEFLPYFSSLTGDFIAEELWEKCAKSLKFSPEYYLSVINNLGRYRRPIEHYLWEGVEKGIPPSEKVQGFNPQYYLSNREFLQNLPLKPFQHFLVFGEKDFTNHFPQDTLTQEPYFTLGDPYLSATRKIIAPWYYFIASFGVLFALLFLLKNLTLERDLRNSFLNYFLIILIVAILSRAGILALVFTLRFPLTSENSRFIYPAHSLFVALAGIGLGQFLSLCIERYKKWPHLKSNHTA
jgi:hypothetical protein